MWEPVLVTDWSGPGPALAQMVPDRRAAHFWDRGRRLSAMLGGTGRIAEIASDRKVQFRMKEVIWDAALLYPPAAAWGSPATLLRAPVVKFREDLAAALGEKPR